MSHAHRSLQDLAGISRHLKQMREQAEALALAQAEAPGQGLAARITQTEDHPPEAQAAVDGLMAHSCQLVTGVIAGQHLGDQFRAPPVIHPRFDGGAQRGVVEFERFWSVRVLRRPPVGHPGVIVPVGIAITPNFTPHHAAVTANLRTDLLIGQTFKVVEAQSPPLCFGKFGDCLM